MKTRAFRASMAVLCAFSLLVQPATAATFNVTGGGDNGAGSLRQAITDANAAGGTNTIAWTIGAGMTLPLLSDLPAVGSNITFDVTAATLAVTLSANPGLLSLSSATVFHNANATQLWTIATNIVGAGSLRKTGAGDLLLNVSNSYQGGTSIDAGTLRLNSDAALGSGSLTFNGGTLKTDAGISSGRNIVVSAAGGIIDSTGFDSTFFGVISGAGALTKIATGTLTLTGSNTFAGGMLINGGTVAFNADAALGTGGATLNGGTLQTTLKLLSTKNITLGAAGGTIDTHSFDSTFSGVFSGAGALKKEGNGTLTLSGANTFTGGTSINAGALRLGANNTLPVGGTLTVASDGSFDMGSFTQTVASFTGPGTTKLSLQAGTSLAVTGNANVTGGTLEVAISPQAVTSGQVFTPITYGSFTGNFAKIVSPAALLFTPAYNAGNLTLTTSLVPFADTAASGNQGAMGRALEPLRAAPSGDAATVLGQLYTLDADDLRSALDRISPAALASIGGVGMAGAGLQSAAISRRMTFLARRAADRPRYAVVDRPSPYPGTLLAAKGGTMGGLDRDFGLSGAPSGFFASALGGGGRLGENNSPSGTTPGYTFHSAGLVVGADYSLDAAHTLGASLGYLRGNATLHGPSAGRVDSKSLRYGVYGSHDEGNLHAGLYLGGASSFITTSREIAFGSLSRTAMGSPSGLELNVQSSASYDIRTMRHGMFSPFAALSYNRLRIGSFSETGAGALNLRLDSQTAQSMQSSLGTRISVRIEEEGKAFTPYLSLAWRHELRSQSRSIRGAFADGGSAGFSVTTGDFARDGTLVGAGFESEWGEALSARLDCAGDFRSHYQSASVNASVRLTF